jgi:hypothetical protein
MSGTWELFGEHVGNLGTLWGNMSGTWELFASPALLPTKKTKKTKKCFHGK